MSVYHKNLIIFVEMFRLPVIVYRRIISLSLVDPYINIPKPLLPGVGASQILYIYIYIKFCEGFFSTFFNLSQTKAE